MDDAEKKSSETRISLKTVLYVLAGILLALLAAGGIYKIVMKIKEKKEKEAEEAAEDPLDKNLLDSLTFKDIGKKRLIEGYLTEDETKKLAHKVLYTINKISRNSEMVRKISERLRLALKLSGSKDKEKLVEDIIGYIKMMGSDDWKSLKEIFVFVLKEVSEIPAI